MMKKPMPNSKFLPFVILLFVGFGCGRSEIKSTTQSSTTPPSEETPLVPNDSNHPGAPSSLNDGNEFSSLSQSPSLHFTEGNDGESGISHHEGKIIDAFYFDVTPWAILTPGASLTGLQLTAGSLYRFVVRSVDKAGNKSNEVISDGWVALDPNAGGGSQGGGSQGGGSGGSSASLGFDDGISNWSRDQSPVFTWNSSALQNPPAAHFEIAIGSSAGASDILGWQNVGLASSYTAQSLALNRGGQYFATLRAYSSSNGLMIEEQGDGWFVMKEMWLADGKVQSMALSEKYIYLGGNFSSFRPWTGAGAWVHKTTGSMAWANPHQMNRISGTVNTAVSDGTGGLYIGGHFDVIGTVAINNLAHLLADGSLDPTWTPNPNGAVSSLLLEGTNLFVGGTFSSIAGATRNNVALFNTMDGSLKTLNLNTNGEVLTFLKNGNTLYFGGSFTTVAGGTTRNRLASVDLVSEALTSWNPNINGAVNTLAADLNNLYVGGSFSQVAGATTRNRFVSYNLTTGNLNTWNPNVGGSIFKLLVLGTELYLGGSFTSVGGNPRSNLAKFDLTTNTLLPWAPGTSYSQVNTLASDGTQLFIGGFFPQIRSDGDTTYYSRGNVASLNLSDGVFTNWNPQTNYLVRVIVLEGTRAFLGGDFDSVGSSSPRNKLARVNRSTGELDPWVYDSFNAVSVIHHVGNKVFVSGGSGFSGLKSYVLKAFNADTGATLPINIFSDGEVHALTSLGNTLYVGGAFTNFSGGTLRNRLAAINIETGGLLDWNPAANDRVRALVASGSTVYVGGQFTGIAGSLTQKYLAAVDAVSGQLKSWDPGLNSFVFSLSDLEDRLYVGGAFTTIGSSNRNYLARFAIGPGQLDSWNPDVNGFVSTISPNGQTLYIAGGFSSVNGSTSRKGLAEIDVNSGTASSWNPMINGFITSIVPDISLIYVGGSFNKLPQDSYFVPILKSTALVPREN